MHERKNVSKRNPIKWMCSCSNHIITIVSFRTESQSFAQRMKVLQIALIVSVGTILVSSVPLEQEKRLIKTSEDEDPQWLNEDQIWVLIRNRQNFIDLTDHPDILKGPFETKKTSSNSIF